MGDRDRVFKNTVEALDKWMHCAILLGQMTVEAGADADEVDRLLRADKAEIDQLLKEKFEQLNSQKGKIDNG